MNAFWRSPPTEEGLYSIAIYLYPTKPTFDCQRQKPRNLRNLRNLRFRQIQDVGNRSSNQEINGMNALWHSPKSTPNTRLVFVGYECPMAFPAYRRGYGSRHAPPCRPAFWVYTCIRVYLYTRTSTSSVGATS